MIEWLNGIVATAGLLIALVALWQTSRANRHSDAANNISREANAIAKQAMRMQEDQTKVRLVVKPQMLRLTGDGEDRKARPVVMVINLSAFPVTIERIWWKTAGPNGAGLYWKNPTITSPYDRLPVRLEPHQALTAVGAPDSFKTVENLLSITAAVASTECGELVEGMTQQWRAHCEQVRAKETLDWDE